MENDKLILLYAVFLITIAGCCGLARDLVTKELKKERKSITVGKVRQKEEDKNGKVSNYYVHYEYYTQTDVTFKHLTIAINKFTKHCLPNEIVALCLELIGDSIIVWNRKLYQKQQEVSIITYDELICNGDVMVKYEERDPNNASIIEKDEKSSKHCTCLGICCSILWVIFFVIIAFVALKDLKFRISFIAMTFTIGYLFVCCVTGFYYHYDKLCCPGSYYLYVEMKHDGLSNTNDIVITNDGDLVNNSE